MGYTPTTTKSTQSIILQPGEEFILPPNAVILYTTNDTSLESTCDVLPNVDLKCYEMTWAVNKAQTPGDALQNDDYSLTFIIGTVEYIIIYELGSGGNTKDGPSVADIESKIPSGLLIDLTAHQFEEGSANQIFKTRLTFKAAESIADKIKIRINAPAFDGGLYILPKKINC